VLRGIRTLVVTVPCVLAGVLGLAGAVVAERVPEDPVVVRPAPVQGAVLDGAVLDGAVLDGPFAGTVTGSPARDGWFPAAPAPDVWPPDGPGGSLPGDPAPDGFSAGGVPDDRTVRVGPDQSVVVSGPAAARTSIATRHIPSPSESALTGAVHPATDQAMAMLIGLALLVLVGGGLVCRPAQRTGPAGRNPGAWRSARTGQSPVVGHSPGVGRSPRTGTSRHAATGNTPAPANAPA
jgi:hypothetical protein